MSGTEHGRHMAGPAGPMLLTRGPQGETARMTALHGSLYDHRADTPVTCPSEGCGWTGTFGELHGSLESLDVLTYCCPACAATVVAVPPPTLAQLRAGAAAGHPDAVAHLPKVEDLERRRLAYLATLLRSPDDLAVLDLAGPTQVTWDIETDDESSWTAERTSVIATADGREAGRERAPRGGFERVIVVRRLLRARYGAGFGGLALTARALAWLSGDRTDVARVLGDPPILAAAYEPTTLLGIHVTCAGGEEFEDPSAALLADLLRERRPDAPYLILDRVDGGPGGPFAQAYARDDGTWLVEYRDSQADPLYRAETGDIGLALAVLAGWSLRAPGWRDMLTWDSYDLAAEQAARAAADDAAADHTAEETVVLRDSRDERGTRHLLARLGTDGSIQIEGQDLGSGVEDAFGSGNTEYEWWWTVRPGNVAAAVAALGGAPDDDVLELLARWSADNGGADPGQRFRDAGVPVEFDNRVGD